MQCRPALSIFKMASGGHGRPPRVSGRSRKEHDMADDRNEVWGHGSSSNTERWEGAFPSKEAAIKDGREYYGHDEFWVIKGIRVDPGEFTPDANEIIERMGERADEEVESDEVESMEDWPDPSEEAKRELNEFLEKWARQYCPIESWRAEGGAEFVPSSYEDEKNGS